MGRILVLLIFAGLAAIFIVIYNAGNHPVQSAIPANSNGTAQGNKRQTKLSQAEKKDRVASHRAPSQQSQKGRKQALSDSVGQQEGVPAAAANAKATDPNADSLMTVKTDSTPVYSANSKRSKVIRVLKRGDKVHPDLEVLDSQGRWRVVTGQQKDKPGFVRDEQIERPPAESSKKKTDSNQPKQF